MEKENNDDIQVDSLAHRLNQLFKSIEIPEQVTEIEISEDTWQAIRHVRKQEKKIKLINIKNPRQTSAKIHAINTLII